MIGAGVGRSGSPIPRLMISTPRAMAACFILSMAANKYGGRVLMRVATSMGKPAMIERSPFYKGTFIQHKLSRLLQEYAGNQREKRRGMHRRQLEADRLH